MLPYKTHPILITECTESHVIRFIESTPKYVRSKSLLQEGENRKKQIVDIKQPRILYYADVL